MARTPKRPEKHCALWTPEQLAPPTLALGRRVQGDKSQKSPAVESSDLKVAKTVKEVRTDQKARAEEAVSQAVTSQEASGGKKSK